MKEYVSSDFGHGGGGLGNHLFKLAITLEYARKYNKIPILKKAKENNERLFITEDCYKYFFNNKLLVIESNIYDTINFNYFIENKNQLPFYIKNNVYLSGYFESFSFFSEEIRDYINNLIYNNYYYKYALRYYNGIKLYFNDNNDNNYIFFHIRRCDIGTDNYNLDYQYFNRVFRKISGKNKHLIIFSDDIKWCKKHLLINTNIYYVNINNHYIELILMSLIQNAILSYTYYNGNIHHSTFSWWGAFLGNKNKKVYIPEKNNFYLNNWIVL